ncbi:hypothetical protein GCM10023319_66520 [Nocardia iowensis]
MVCSTAPTAKSGDVPPKLTVFTIDDRLTIQVEYDTAQQGAAGRGDAGAERAGPGMCG